MRPPRLTALVESSRPGHVLSFGTDHALLLRGLWRHVRYQMESSEHPLSLTIHIPTSAYEDYETGHPGWMRKRPTGHYGRICIFRVLDPRTTCRILLGIQLQILFTSQTTIFPTGARPPA